MVLFNAGLHVPVIPFVDVVGNGGKIVPAHIAATGLNVGEIDAPIMETVILKVAMHPRASFTVIVYGTPASPVKILLA